MTGIFADFHGSAAQNVPCPLLPEVHASGTCFHPSIHQIQKVGDF